MRIRARSRGLAALAVCAASLHTGEARAANPLGTNCTVTPNTDALAFGTYNPVNGSPTTALATVVVQCSALVSVLTNINFVLTLSAGNSGNVANRSMSGSTNNLPYNVYESASYTTVWDATVGVSGTVSLPAIGVVAYGTATIYGYGRILASQPVAAGSYMDSLMITVTF
jgi:spore coat protein U-like protein